MIPVIVTGIFLIGFYSYRSTQQSLSQRLEILKKIRAAPPALGDNRVSEFLPEDFTPDLVEFAEHILTDARCIDPRLYTQLRLMDHEGFVVPEQYRLWMTVDHLYSEDGKYCIDGADFRRILDQQIHAHQYQIDELNQRSLYFDSNWR